ncbi:group II truncated hemoglobin [uncultured Candidatus Thioglobus sp.]|jgi:hemoglobin|uniref:group II truncated hemoglobin n=1 Tax=uncultured Candidatus Thioglobus sp. TaxID=655186 RepID=UPI001D669A4B|nr:group II truncated hemoglobin [Candidatus Thioglobus sp.]MBT3745228.1 group II truncated hemoglobin [Candidatus Thioglobus sp.]MBT4001385.1 group II truncated hemoglobin [Candidatus Thioglobus sp.]MBT4182068.1 group II truncated hemoglobin [Candidatus Thioglobus sp.]MBT6022706.1 group II truncated hemoglobin [Candidatus Thioglobus sp.]
MLTQYEQLGGELAVKNLVNRFYDLMDQRTDTSELRAMHAKSLKISREKLHLFLSGWLGGPSLYIEKYGHPKLRARHMPFTITPLEKDQWLSCMNQALQEHITDNTLLLMTLSASFKGVAEHMLNTQD